VDSVRNARPSLPKLTRLENGFIGNGALLSDQARAWVLQCEMTTSGSVAFESCVDDTIKAAKHEGIIDGNQSAFLRQCAQHHGKPTN